jgi:23S rRNA pseudouridine2604 synthase
MTDSIRLAKRVAELRACSRSEAERIISGGWVRVDGVVIEEPQFRVAEERVEIDPEANPAQTEPVTLLLHKPAGVEHAALATPDIAGHWSEDPAGIQPLKLHFTRLTALVPLDTDAAGLVIYTQDWRLERKLTESAATVEHELVVEVAGEMAEGGLERLNRGIAFEGRTPASIKVSWQNENRLRVALKGARIGQVRHLCESVGLRVVSLKRIRLGGVPLGKLPSGQWRYLRPGERF